MLPTETVASLMNGLAEYAGADRAALPAPDLQVISEYAPANGPTCLDFNLIHETVWRGTDRGRHLPDRVTLTEFTELLTATVGEWLPRQRQPRFTIVGFTLMYDDPAVPAGPDRNGADAPTPVVMALDMDGRCYLRRVGGDRDGTVEVIEPGMPLPIDATDPLSGNAQVARSALTRLVATATDDRSLDSAEQPDAPDQDSGPLVPGDIVDVHGDRWQDDERAQLWVVVDTFIDYTIAVLGGDGYQTNRVPRSDLTPVAPQWIRKVRRDDTYAYLGTDDTAAALLDEAFAWRGTTITTKPDAPEYRTAE